MSTNADALVRDSIAAYRSGKKEQARSLLLEAVALDEHHEQAWLWLSAVVDSVEDQITCLENVLTINPKNEKARQGIQLLNEKMTSSTAASASHAEDEEDEDPFASVSFTQTAPAQTAPALSHASAPPDDEEELPDDSAWDFIATSSASARQPSPEPSAADYGNWIANLKIGSNEATEAFGDVAEEDVFAAAPFIGDDDLVEDDQPFELDRNVFGYDEDEDDGMSSVGPFSTSPFSADIDSDAEVSEKPLAKPVPAPAARVAPAAVPSSPSFGRTEERSLLSDFGEEEDFDDNLLDNDYDDADLGAVDPSEFFKFIPAEIKATRLPGTNERYPALVIVGLLLLLAFNVGGLALVYMTLTGSV